MREYKGSHPRGNLSTPDYKVARAQERLAEIERASQAKIREYENRVKALTDRLERAVNVNWESTEDMDIIRQYLMTCPDEQYGDLLDAAAEFLSRLPAKEQIVALKSFQDILTDARKKAAEQAKKAKGIPAKERQI